MGLFLTKNEQKGKAMRLDDAIDDYFNHIFDTVSENTERIYAYHLSFLLSYFGSTLEVAKITSRNMRLFRKKLGMGRSRDLSLSSKNDILGSVKRFFKFLFEDGVLEHDPALLLKNFKEKKKEKKEPKAISEDDLVAFLETAKKVDYQSYVCAVLLADTGCRISAICNLKKQNVDLQEGSIVVKEKGGRIVKKHLSRFAVEVLQTLVDVRKNCLFLKTNDTPWHRGSARCRFFKIKEKAGIEGVANPHSFRHYYAKCVLKNGGSLNDVKQLLGHSSILTTAKYYTVWTEDELEERKHRYSPFGE